MGFNFRTEIMKGDKDKLKMFVAIRDELIHEKAAIEARLAEINTALAQVGLPVAVRSKPQVATAPATAPKGPKGPKPRKASPGKARKQNSMSLREAVIAAIKAKPLTKQEILDSIVKAGYVFTTTNPMNSLGVILYGKNPKFKNDHGRFSLD